MVDSLRRLGIGVEHDASSATIRVPGCGGTIPADSASLEVANSGTSLRFLTAMLAAGQGTYRLDGTPRMRQRPVADLLAALNGLGADARSRPRDRLPAGDDQRQRPRRRLRLREGGRLQPVPQRAAHGAPLRPRHHHGRGPGRPGLAAVRGDDARRDEGVRRAGREPQVPPLRRPPGALSRPRLRHRARRLGGQLLLRPGGRARRDRHRRRAGRGRASRGTWRSSTCWSTWAAPSPASRAGRPSPAARSAPSTST